MYKDKHLAISSIWNKYNFSSQSVKIEKDFISQMLTNIFCPGPSYFYIIDFSKNRQAFDYLSPSVEDVLGVDKNTFSFGELIDRIHPEDIEYVGECENLICDFAFNKLDPALQTSYKYAYNFRLKKQDGTYVLLLHQAITLTTDGFGQLSKVLSIETVVDHFVPTNNHRLSIIGLNGQPSYLGIEVSEPNTGSYLRPANNLFTSREIEVIRLFSDGLTAKEVADILHLSTGTIRTHRQNILKKSGCNNMTAVVTKCVRERLV